MKYLKLVLGYFGPLAIMAPLWRLPQNSRGVGHGAPPPEPAPARLYIYTNIRNSEQAAEESKPRNADTPEVNGERMEHGTVKSDVYLRSGSFLFLRFSYR